MRPHAESLLYSRIHWTWLDSQIPPITLLLRSILPKPELASHIHNVMLDGDSFWYGRSRVQAPKIPVSEAELKEPIAFVEALKLPDSGLWIRELRNGTMDAFVAVFLSQLTNLKYLRLGPNFAKESLLVGMVFWSALCEPADRGLPTFQYLQDVSFQLRHLSGRGTRSRNTEDVLPLFYLPAVKRISVSIESPASIKNPAMLVWPTEQPPMASRIRSLDLTCVRECHLEQLLSVTTGLENLTWSWYYDSDLEDQLIKPIIDLDQIARALSPVRDTLAHLKISAATGLGNSEIEFPSVTTRGSLHAIINFNALKKFEVPVPFLAGSFSPATASPLAHAIPRNIEVLTITDDLYLQDDYEWTDIALLDAIRCWLKDWKASTPHLRGFHLLLKVIDFDDWGPDMRNELRKLGAEAGILVEITKLNPP